MHPTQNASDPTPVNSVILEAFRWELRQEVRILRVDEKDPRNMSANSEEQPDEDHDQVVLSQSRSNRFSKVCRPALVGSPATQRMACSLPLGAAKLRQNAGYCWHPLLSLSLSRHTHTTTYVLSLVSWLAPSMPNKKTQTHARGPRQTHRSKNSRLTQVKSGLP